MERRSRSRSRWRSALTLRPATAQLALCLANDACSRPRAARRGRSPSRDRGRRRRCGAASDPGAGAVSTGWARRFGAADADVAAARDVILDVVEAAAERKRKAAG